MDEQYDLNGISFVVEHDESSIQSLEAAGLLRTGGEGLFRPVSSRSGCWISGIERRPHRYG